MASPTTPTHGKLGNLTRLRPNGFAGAGLNDLTWDFSSFSGAASTVFEVEIDAEDAPDTFKWRQDGGAYTEDVAITGAAQALADGVTVTFAATTGHTLADEWTAGWLKDEACTESGELAQITDADKRIIDPNDPPVFTDTGGETVLITDFSQGRATFGGNVTVVSVTGKYIPREALEVVGQVFGWQYSVNLDMAACDVMGEKWKTYVPGQAGFTGSADKYFIGSKSFMDALAAALDGSEPCMLLELYNYDPDADQTGDRLTAWATISGLSVNAAINAVVDEKITFTGQGVPSFTANA